MKVILFITIYMFLITGCENSNEIILEEQNILKIDISMIDETLNVNELPKLTATISNVSSDDIYLYKDFNYGYYPKISLEIFEENLDSALSCVIWVRSPREYVLEQNHFIFLYPEKSFELFKDSEELVSNYSCVFQNPGNYKMLLKLDYNKYDLSSWTTKKDYDSTLLSMFDLIPKEYFLSNEITFTIK